LIVLQLVADGVLCEPMLYPSLFFETHRALYYDLLNEVRLRGDWERWLDFFAEGIEASATQAVATANALFALVNADRDRIAGLGRAAASALEVHQALQRQPISTSAALVKVTGLTPATVNKSLAHLERIGIVGELTNRQRGRNGRPNWTRPGDSAHKADGAEPRSLPDAEPAENHPQQVIRRELPRDLAQPLLRQPQLLGKEIQLLRPFARMRPGRLDVRLRGAQRDQVPLARDEGRFAAGLPAGQLEQQAPQAVDPRAGPG
jgi:hypothetical protein